MVTCARYAAGGSWHDVIATRDDTGRWQVLDAADTRIVLVETLTGHDDRLDQARAVAVDYAAQQSAYREGRRARNPLPRPNVLHSSAGAVERSVYSGRRAQADASKAL